MGECLDSVLAQTFDDYEVICINDGSTDRSGEVLRAYAAADRRICVIDQPNRGLSAARNAGLQHARGEYVAFLDSDDLWTPDMLGKTVATAEANESDIVIFDYYILSDRTGELSFYRDQAIYGALDGRTFAIAEAPQMVQFIGAWDRLFRRSFLGEGGFSFIEGKLYEDVPFCFQTEFAARRISLIADHLYYYRRDVEGSITADESGSRRHNDDFLYVQGIAQEQLRAAGASDEMWAYYGDYYMEYAYMHQSRSHSLGYFCDFFSRVRDQSIDFLGFDRGTDTPQEHVYRLCLRGNRPRLAWFLLKANNQLRRPFVAWSDLMANRRVVREGLVDGFGRRLVFPERSPHAVEGFTRDEMEGR